MIYLAYIAIIALVCSVTFIARRKREEPIRETHYDAPSKIERNDFPDLDAPTLVAIFTSQACDSCSGVWSKVSVLQSREVDVINIVFEDEVGKKLHKKYDIEAVPTVVICDENGVTQKAYLGSVTATDLWAGVAGVRGADISYCDNH
jgi:hypothetical protein